MSLLAMASVPALIGGCSAASSSNNNNSDGSGGFDTGSDSASATSADGTTGGTATATATGTVTGTAGNTASGTVTTGGTVTSSGATGNGATTGGNTVTTGATTGATTATTATTGGTSTSATTGSATTGTTGMVMCPSPPAGVKAAPCGYYTKGNKVYALDGSVHLFHGVARPSLEWSATGESLGGSDADLMATGWKANTVRFSLNQAMWLDASTGPSYQRTISTYVDVYHKRGMDIILDLHWNVIAAKGGNGQQTGPDSNSTPFWQQVATAYKSKGYVLFELYNEPHDITDDTWFTSMSGLYNTVRSAGADNVVIIGGLDWAYDLTVVTRKWPSNMGYNIMFASHPYQDKQDLAGKVDGVGATWPVIFTEFGDRSGSCGTSASTNVITHADQKGYSWTGWGWYPSDCKFPSLISDWMATPTAEGMVVKNALAKY